MKIEAVGILGAGSGTSELAGLMARKGLQVRIYDNFKDNLNMTYARLDWSLSRSGQADLLKNIELVQDAAKLGGADMVLELQRQDAAYRAEVFGKIGAAVSKECVIALWCATEPIGSGAENFSEPARVIGLNFHYPAAANKLVEIVRTDLTSDFAIDSAVEMLRGLDKTPVMAHDSPGIIVERLRRPFILSALRLLELGKGLPHQIDAAVKESGGCALGPFEMADAIGLDRDYQDTETIWRALKSPDRLKPSSAEDRLVQYGQLGKKSTIGFYLYDNGEIVGENPVLRDIVHYLGISSSSGRSIFLNVLKAVAEEARLLVTEMAVSEFDIETAVKLAFGWPRGPFTIAREMSAELTDTQRARIDQWGDAI